MIFGKHINKYLLKYLVLFIIGIAALITVDWFQLEIPKIVGSIVNQLKDGKHISPQNQDFIRSILKILEVAAILLVGRIVWRVTLFYASTKIEANIRHDMFLKAERLSSTYFHNNKVGTVMSWLTNDLETLQDYIGWGTLMLVDGMFLTIFALIKMFNVDWALSLLALIPIVFIAIWGALVEKFMSLKWKERQESSDRLYDYSQENFTGIRVIKAFVKENQQIRKFSELARKDKNINVDFVRLSVVFDVIIEIIISLVFAILMGFGGWFAYAFISGNPITIFGHSIKLQAGTVVEMIGYFDALIWPMIALGQVITMHSKARASYSRIANFLDAYEDIQNPNDAVILTQAKGKIEFKNLTFGYPTSDHNSLKNISLTINPGEKIGVIGRVACGKSTLMNVLLRTFNVPKGTVFIDDVDIMDIDITSLRDNISYVPQDNFLFSDSIENNICFSKEEVNDDECVEASKFADVYENIVEFKDEFKTVSGERGQTLSGGQKQRIATARAYLKKAPIMIMDDSVSAVDIDTEKKILANVNEKRKGQTTIVVASRVSTVRDFDRVIVMNRGELEAFDTPENLLKISPTFAKMVELQKLAGEEGGEM